MDGTEASSFATLEPIDSAAHRPFGGAGAPPAAGGGRVAELVRVDAQFPVAERLFAGGYGAVFRFVGLEPPATYADVFRRRTKVPSALSPAALELLAAAYRGPTDRLYGAIGVVPECERWYADRGLPATVSYTHLTLPTKPYV